MAELTFAQGQAQMREAYLNGAPGALVSGLVWLLAGVIATSVSAKSGVYALLIGGALIFPLSVLLTKLLGRRGGHDADNPLGRLAMESTFWMLAGIAVAFGLATQRIEWFFPAMLLTIGGRYLAFQTIYGLRLYWVFGAVLCTLGVACVLLKAPPPAVAMAGGAVEVAFAALLFRQKAVLRATEAS